MKKITLIPFILALILLQACNFLSKPDYVGEFKEGYAVAKNLGKWGLVNEDLDPVVPFEYDSILPPSEGRTAVMKDDLWGYLNKSFILDIPIKYYSATPFENNFAIVSWDIPVVFFLIDTNGEKSCDAFEQPISNEFFYLVHRVQDLRDPSPAYGLIFRKIKPLSLQWFTYASLSTTDSVAIAGDSLGYVLISSHNIPIAGPFEDFSHTNEPGLIITMSAKNWTLRNLQGNAISDAYNEIGSVVRDTASGKSGSWLEDVVLGVITLGIYNIYKEAHKQDDITETYTYFANGLLQVQKNGNTGYINKKGEVIIPLEYQEGQAFSGGTAIVKKNGKWGAINNINKVIVPFEYNSLCSNGDKLLIAIKQKNQGVFDNNGQIVLPIAYHWVQFLSNHGFVAYDKEKYCYYDSTATKNTGFIYDKISNFKYQRAVVCKNEKYGFIDQSGKECIACTYDFASDFSGDRACVKQNGLYGYVNPSGKLVIPCRYETAADFEIDIARVRENGQQIVINRKGEKL